MPKLNRSQFKFRKHDSIGSEAAEQDTEFLRECFIDTGDLATLRDTRNSRRIVVGRTGAGKTALLLLLADKEERVSWIEPDQLAIAYLANSTIIRQLEAVGVNLDLFYRLLWRHIFTVELIQLKWVLRTEEDQRTFLSRIRQLLGGDRRKDEALAYLTEWGEHFWKDTEYRIHQVTTKFENDIRAGLGSKLPLLNADVTASDSASVQDTKEIVHRAQEIVNGVQMQKLAKMIDILAEDMFNDEQKRYFVLVDRLDENWVADPIRYKLIRALIETVKDLQKVQNAKLVVALRKDLLQRVFRETRDAGFQEEKYQALYMPLTWTRESLIAVMDRRLHHLVQHRFSGRQVTWRDIFPDRIGNETTPDYLVSRTLYRPRDIIQFCNCCIELAPDRPEISAHIVRDAEYATF